MAPSNRARVLAAEMRLRAMGLKPLSSGTMPADLALADRVMQTRAEAILALAKMEARGTQIVETSDRGRGDKSIVGQLINLGLLKRPWPRG